MSFQALCCIRFVGVIFAISSLAKAWSPSSFQSMLERLQVRNSTLQVWLSLSLIFVESTLAFALLNLMYLQIVLYISATLIFMMLITLVVLYFKGYRDSCSCYGQWIKLSPLQAIKLDLIYLGMLLFGLFELKEISSWPIKEGPIIPFLIGVGMMGLGKLRAKF